MPLVHPDAHRTIQLATVPTTVPDDLPWAIHIPLVLCPVNVEDILRMHHVALRSINKNSIHSMHDPSLGLLLKMVMARAKQQKSPCNSDLCCWSISTP
jgi:hypothetical protein